jgi:hypothetical protein
MVALVVFSIIASGTCRSERRRLDWVSTARRNVVGNVAIARPSVLRSTSRAR